mgnify:FL=1
MNDNETVVILDFYGQYNQLIARRVRECNVYSVVMPYDTPIEKIKSLNPKGIIFTGGPASVYEEGSPRCDESIFNLGIPILGICYGMQLMSTVMGGNVKKGVKREYGEIEVALTASSPLFVGLPEKNVCLMSHTDLVDKMPDGFEVIANTSNCPIAGMQNIEKGFYGIQFHPEVNNTCNGTTIIRNFLYNVCKCSGDWKMSSFVEDSINKLKEKIGDKKVLCALSGGVDSSVAAVLLHKSLNA